MVTTRLASGAAVAVGAAAVTAGIAVGVAKSQHPQATAPALSNQAQRGGTAAARGGISGAQGGATAPTASTQPAVATTGGS